MNTAAVQGRAEPGSEQWETQLQSALAAIAERAADHDRDSSFPHDGFEDLRPVGLVALTVPTEHTMGAPTLACAGLMASNCSGAMPSLRAAGRRTL